MNSIRADLRQLDNLNVITQGTPIGASPQRKKLSALEKTALKSTLALAKKVNVQLGFLEEPLHVSDHPPVVSIQKPVKMAVGRTAASAKNITIACGLSGAAMAVIGVTYQGGVYGSDKPEAGVFASFGGGWWSTMGAVAGPAVTCIFGPPSDLAGVLIGIGADVGIPGLPAALGGLLLFSPPPFRFLGYVISLSVGPSAIPVLAVTIQVSNTWTKPILK